MTLSEAYDQLIGPFPMSEIEFRPGSKHEGRAQGLPFIKAEQGFVRLDLTVGPENWAFHYVQEARLPGEEVVRVRGSLTICGVTRSNGGEAKPENPDTEVYKAAITDAMKRCLDSFGIGRYLRFLPKQWVPFDAGRRRLQERPRYTVDQLAIALQRAGYKGNDVLAVAAQALGEDPPKAETPPPRVPRVETLPTERNTTRCEGFGFNCGKPVTTGQSQVSQGKYGKNLCLECQALAGRASAGNGARSRSSR